VTAVQGLALQHGLPTGDRTALHSDPSLRLWLMW
jgi:hypothetical protein